jgi:hypothetical protein
VPVLLALLSALASAIGLVVQRDSSRAAPAGMRGTGLLGYLVRQPKWLLGQGAWVVAIGLQALALYLGRLSVVQPVLVSELVFVLVIRRLVMHWPVRAAAWGAAALVCVSLSLFLVAAEPRGGHPTPTASAWLWALVATGGLSVSAVLLGGRRSPVRRAACYATAAATMGALEASFLKTATQTLSSQGLVAALTDWPVYALALAGAASGVLVQTALRIGPLTISQPLLVVVNPLVSVVLSVWLFGEHFTDDPATVTLGACAFVGIVGGVALLTSKGPRLPVPPGVAPAPPL